MAGPLSVLAVFGASKYQFSARGFACAAVALPRPQYPYGAEIFKPPLILVRKAYYDSLL